MRTSIPNPLGGGLVLARTANELIEAQEGATYRGRGHKTTRGVLPRLSARTVVSGGTTFKHPFQVYLEGGYICVRGGNHLWFNEQSNGITQTTMAKAVTDAWQSYTSGNRTVYVKRIYNSDGSATVTLENTADSYVTVIGGINNTEARWILAEIADSVITQWWTGGDIYELRVA